ncbi:ribonuclease H-like superfamily protein [Striga asiatica]|uniref:Ribonuclease H-like superfamily protein n=1 Tax=Striga asiatica TaxID=4170 RepID=A0A5A7PHV1_STRAF|nr:ribonuclease H-like superfamily protein [Striga asiatica]
MTGLEGSSACKVTSDSSLLGWMRHVSDFRSEWSEVAYLVGGSVERDSLVVVYPIALIIVVDSGFCKSCPWAPVVALMDKWRAMDQPESSKNHQKIKHARRRTWKMKIKAKIEHFLWRGVNNILHVLSNIKTKGLQVDPICKFYGEGPET